MLVRRIVTDIGAPRDLAQREGPILCRLEQRQRRLDLKSLSAAWSRLTGQPERNLILKVEEADPAVIMEAGLIMPRPGEEAAWLEANKTALGEVLAAA
jgi:hypothetical protein